jgi:hypothetical protein
VAASGPGTLRGDGRARRRGFALLRATLINGRGSSPTLAAVPPGAVSRARLGRGWRMAKRGPNGCR